MISPKEKLKALIGRETARCIWLDIPSAMTAEIAGQAGAELCVVDAEHGQIGPETMVQMLRTLELSGTPGIVRVGDAAPGSIKYALDGGAVGVIVPYVESVEEARAAIDTFYLPPRGKRGTATIVTRAGGFGADPDYGPRWNDTGLLALMIETGKGLAAAPDIAALEGADILFFGPYDFATDRGLDPIGDGEAILQAYRSMADTAHQAGKLAAAFPWPSADAARLLSEGADLVAIGADVIALKQGLASALAACAAPD